MKCGVCGATWNVAISDMVCLKCRMCDVEYGVEWNVLSWYVECCIMQKCGKLRCDVKCGGVELW